MCRVPPRSIRTDTLFPYPAPFRTRWQGYGFLPGYQQPPNNTLPAYKDPALRRAFKKRRPWYIDPVPQYYGWDGAWHYFGRPGFYGGRYNRSEEHTSELQSLMRISYAVFCLKKKKNNKRKHKR